MVYAVTEKEIFDLLEPFSIGADKGELTLETRLFADLGIDGDDGHDVLDAFAARFKVEVTGMNSFCYFDDEPPKVMYSEATWLLGLLSQRFRDYVDDCLAARKEITVGDLYVSARLRRWDYPEEPRADAQFATWRDAQLRQFALHIVVGLAFILATIMFENWNLSVSDAAIFLIVIWTLSVSIRFWLELRWLRRLHRSRKDAEKRI